MRAYLIHRTRLPAYALSAIAIALIVRDVHACSCASPTVAQQLEYSDYALVGTVVDVDTTGSFLVARIRVERVWKGRVTREFEIWTRRSGASCGFNDPGRKFEIGVRFILYAHEESDYIGAVFTTLCDRNRKYDEAGSDLEALGRSHAPLGGARVPDGDLLIDALYPNPAQNELTIRFELREAGLAQIVLYDMLGRQVATFEPKWHLVGHYALTATLPDLAAGPYVLALHCGGGTAAQVIAVAQ